MSEREFKTLADFWPFYLGEHLDPLNRALHALGSSMGLGWLIAAAALQQPWFVLAGLVNGYAFAWIGHFAFEKNRPATFNHPLKSFLSDWRLLLLVLSGGAEREIERLGLRSAEPASAEAAVD
jgi:hypothetical protein